MECLRDPSYSETIAVSFDQVEATASCAVVLTPLLWLWF